MKRLTLVLLACLTSVALSAQATSVDPGAAGEVHGYGKAEPLLGQGYSSDMTVPAAKCLATGPADMEGSAQGMIDFDQNVNLVKVKSILNQNMSGGLTLGPFELNASESFLNSAQATALSESYIYMSEYQGRDANMSWGTQGPALNYIGKQYASDPQAFRRYCGDKYYDSFQMGGYLFFQVTFHFLNAQDKANFDAKVGASYSSLASLSGEMSKVVTGLDSRGSIAIKALQIGGDTRQLGQILGVQKPGQSAPVVKCNFKNVSACQQTISTLINYASGSGANDFPAQIVQNYDPHEPSKGAAVIGVHRSDYLDTGIPSINPGNTVVSSDIQSARAEAQKEYQTYQNDFDQAQTAMSQAYANDFNYQSLLKEYVDKAYYNEQLAKSAGTVCFLDPQSCVATVQKLDKEVLPLESSQLLTPPTVYTSAPITPVTMKEYRMGDNQEVYQVPEDTSGHVITIGGFPANMTSVRLVAASSGSTEYNAMSPIMTTAAGSPGPNVLTLNNTEMQIIASTPPLSGHDEVYQDALTDDFSPALKNAMITNMPWSFIFESDYTDSDLVNVKVAPTATANSVTLTLTGDPIFKDPQTTRFKVIFGNGQTHWCNATGSPRTCQIAITTGIGPSAYYTATIEAYAGDVKVGGGMLNVITPAS